LLSSSSAISQQLFGQDKHRWAFYLILYISKASAAVPGGRFSNPPTTPSPNVGGKQFAPDHPLIIIAV